MLNSIVLEAVRTLDDDYWVLAEFDLDRRNIDWLVIRAVPADRPEGRFSTLYFTELKQTSAQLSGGEYGRWSVARNGIAEEIVPGNQADENYWRQTINTVNVIRYWLFNNQRRYLSLPRLEYAEAAVKVWPTLLILSEPVDLMHRLPLAPANRFGAFHYDLDVWLDTLKRWDAKQGLQLTADEIARLVAAIGLQELPQSVIATRREVVSDRASGELDWLQGFARWATGIEERLACLEARHHTQASVRKSVADLAERLERIEAELRDAAAKSSPKVSESIAPAMKPHEPVIKPETETAGPIGVATKLSGAKSERPLSPAEKECITTALANLRRTSKSRTMSSLFVEMNRLLGGETLRQRNYNGYGSARAMLDQATKEQIIRYGPIDGTGAPTIYFYAEVLPQSR
jgi:hypothetical protein